MLYWITTNPWPGVIAWMILYTSDYYLTIYSARGFREIGHFQFEGSFELTPQYQNDINTLRPVSKLHIFLLLTYSLLLLVIWWITRSAPFGIGLEWTYPLYLGMLLLVEVSIHLRHLRNVTLIREIRKHGGVEGQISYKKWFSYRNSANELYVHAALFLGIAILTYSLFFLGGAVMCYATGFKHARLAKKVKANSVQMIEAKP